MFFGNLRSITSITILNSNLIFSIINHNTNRNCFVPFCFQNVNIYLNEAIIHILLMKPSIQCMVDNPNVTN